jgi:hypothetical protein
MNFNTRQFAQVVETAKAKTANNAAWSRNVEKDARALMNGQSLVTVLVDGGVVSSPRGTYRIVNGRCSCPGAACGHCYHLSALRIVELADELPAPAPARGPTITRSTERNYRGPAIEVTRCNGRLVQPAPNRREGDSMANDIEQLEARAPAENGPRPIRDIIANLSKPLTKRHLKTRRQGGTELTYIEWHCAIRYLDHYAPGWSYAVKSVALVGNLVTVVAAISIPCLEGVVPREATGREESDAKGYGDAVSNAEAMALKR